MARHTTFLLGALFTLTLTAVAGDLRVRPDQRTLLLATEKSSTMQQELDAAVALGFSVISGASARFDEISYLLERDVERGSRRFYRLLSTRRLSTLENELNQSAAQGFRLHPRSVLYNECEFVLLMEPLAAEDLRYEYRILGTHRTSTLQRELESAVETGFRAIDLVSADENVVILERERSH